MSSLKTSSVERRIAQILCVYHVVIESESVV